MFDADRPILKSEQDRLNRSVFAKSLARSMLDHKTPDSLVIGLYGGWGSGKTSVINLVLEELHFAAKNTPNSEKPIILNFSPWSYSGQEQLIYSFFRRLSSALRGVDYLENAEHIIHLLELYVSFFTQKPVPKSLRKKRSLLEKITYKNHADIYAWDSGRDLTSIKMELNELLRQQKHKIIICIDNISRLYDHEIKQIFQIVKSMGDYSNTVYLLALDKEHIVRAINKLDGSGGKEFIEKIIQLPFEVPPILQQDLENILADKLNRMFNAVPIEAWNAEYWADIYYRSLKYFFNNCRDITHYINTLEFSYPHLRDIVNPVDFFALSAIEIFLPNVYFGIRDNKDLFTDLIDNVYVLDQNKLEKDKERCNEILRRNHLLKEDILLDLLLQLFPRLRQIYQPNLSSYHSPMVARKLKRICSPDLFDAYFRLSMQKGQIPESEFKTILSLANSETAFDEALTRLNQDDRITKFLDQLDSNILQNIPEENIASIINALLDDGDLFPQGINSPLVLNTPMRIHRIIHRLLQRINKAEERFDLLQTAIAKANKSLYIVLHELMEQGHEHRAEESTFIPMEFRDLLPDQLELLRKLAVSRIESWAQSGRLAEHPKLLSILYDWCEWGGAENSRVFVQKLTETDRGLITFLLATLDKAIYQAMHHYEKDPAWEAYLENINAFIPAKYLEQHATLLFEDAYFEKLKENEQLAIMIFLDLMKAKTNKNIPSTSA